MLYLFITKVIFGFKPDSTRRAELNLDLFQVIPGESVLSLLKDFDSVNVVALLVKQVGGV